MRRALVLSTAALLGCRESPAPAPQTDAASLAVGLSPPAAPEAPSAPPRAPAPQADARCPWRWSADTALRLEAAAAVTDLVATCTNETLAVAWREGARVRATTRALQPDARWSDPVTVGDDATRLGEPTAAARDLWLAWETAAPLGASGVRVAAVRNGVVLRSDPTVLGRGRVTQLHTLHGQGDIGLVAATLTGRDGPQTLLLRMSATGTLPTGGARLADGTTVASAPGSTAFLAVLRRGEGTGPGRWQLTAWRIDARLAAAFGQSVRPGVWGALPEGAASTVGALPLGPGTFDFIPRATEDGAVLVQTVVGAERGMARVAWFGDTPADARIVPLQVAPSALASIGRDDDAAARAEYWDETHALVTRRVTRQGAEDPVAVEAPLPAAPAVLAVAHGTRRLRCGRGAWRVALVTAEPASPPQLTADRADCSR